MNVIWVHPFPTMICKSGFEFPACQGTKSNMNPKSVIHTVNGEKAYSVFLLRGEGRRKEGVFQI